MACLQVKNNTYYYVVYDKVTKKNKWVSSKIKVDPKNPNRSRKKAEKAMAVYENELAELAKNPPMEDQVVEKIPIADFFNAWLENHRFDIRVNTYAAYRMALDNHIIPYFRKYPVAIQDVKPAQLKAYFDEKRKELSICTLKKHRCYMTSMFKYARLKELLLYDPMENVTLPKAPKFRSDIYDDDEINKLLLLAKEQKEPIFPAIYLAAKLGLRRSEAAAVKWSCVNWKRNTLRVNRTIIYENSLPVERETMKNETSYRDIPLTPKVVAFLKELQEEQERNRTALGRAYKSEFNDFVCVWPDGTPISPNVISTRFRSFLEKNQFHKIRYHDLRHSAATSMVFNSGFNYKAVSELLGHSDVSTTLGIYTHPNAENIAKVLSARDENIEI